MKKQVFVALSRAELEFAFADGTTRHRAIDHHVALEVGTLVSRVGLEGETTFVVDNVEIVMVDEDAEAPNCTPHLTQQILLREVEDDPGPEADPVENHTTVTPTE